MIAVPSKPIGYDVERVERNEAMIRLFVPDVLFKRDDYGLTSYAYRPSGTAFVVADAWHGALRDPWYVIGELTNWESMRARVQMTWKMFGAGSNLWQGKHLQCRLWEPSRLPLYDPRVPSVVDDVYTVVTFIREREGYHMEGGTPDDLWWFEVEWLNIIATVDGAPTIIDGITTRYQDVNY